MSRRRIFLFVLEVGGEHVSADQADVVLDVDHWQNRANVLPIWNYLLKIHFLDNYDHKKTYFCCQYEKL